MKRGALLQKEIYNPALDALRLFACIAVVILHVSAVYIYQYNHIQFKEWHLANLVDSSVRWCVPVFVMLSGCLNINARAVNASEYWRRRFGRLIPIIAAWSAVYILYSGVNNFDVIFARLLAGVPYYHLYFLFLIAGLYLFTPIFARYAIMIDDETLKKTAILCLIVASLASLINQQKMNLLTWFLPFIGYYLIGRSLCHNPIPMRLALIGLITSIIFTTIGTWLLVDRYGAGKLGLYFYNYLSPPVIIMSLCIFSVFQQIEFKEMTFIKYLSSLTLGVYLIHVMVFEFLVAFLMKNGIGIRPIPAMFLFSFSTLVISFICVALASTVPIFRRFFA